MEPARSRHRRRSLKPVPAAIAFILLLAWVIPADAYDPVLHEFIPPDDREDVTFAATTADGDLPAALDTKSGMVRAPAARPPSEADKAYQEPHSQQAQYRPDRDTRRPSAIHYDDPFVPSVAPFKRLRAFDMVGNDYALGVRDATVTRVSEGGQSGPGEDEFYADLVVDFGSSTSVLVPSVGPGSRILRQHTTPPTPIEVWRDGAENWYARATSSQRGRVHLVLQIAAPRAAFGGELALPSWSGLAPVAPLPPRPARGFARFKAALDLTRAMSPTETVRRLVAYFRAFVPSDDPPFGYDDIYVDLALSQKGVCRHRAFAFLVTALGLGIPARMIANEAHAWVEVRGQTGWQRIDLGGAAAARIRAAAGPLRLARLGRKRLGPNGRHARPRKRGHAAKAVELVALADRSQRRGQCRPAFARLSHRCPRARARSLRRRSPPRGARHGARERDPGARRRRVAGRGKDRGGRRRLFAASPRRRLAPARQRSNDGHRIARHRRARRVRRRRVPPRLFPGRRVRRDRVHAG
jgi:hypothetical protein